MNTTETSPETQTATISSKSRNLGYDWTTYPAQFGRETHPLVTGGLRTVDREMRVHKRAVSGGGYSSEALFVAGRRVTHIWDFWCEMPETEYDEDGRVTNYAAEPTSSGWGWIALDGLGLKVSTVVSRIREGETLKVRLAPAPGRRDPRSIAARLA